MVEIAKRLLNIAQMRKKLGNRSRSSIYRDVEAGRLPRPLHLGGRPYWVESGVDERLEQLEEQEAA